MRFWHTRECALLFKNMNHSPDLCFADLHFPARAYCGDKPLKRRYCRQETIQGQGQDFLDYIVADNQMEFSYKNGDTVVPL